MTIKQLKKQISKLPDNMKIYLMSDGEGNDCKELDEADADVIVMEGEYGDAEVFDPNGSADDAMMSEEEWADFKKGCKKVLLLWPVG